MMDAPTTRAPSPTSLEFSSLYSTACSASSFDCVIHISNSTNWINALPLQIFPSAHSVLVFYDISTQLFMPETRKLLFSSFLPLCYPVSHYIQG